MDNCYSCGVPFDGTNNSLEHIINNSIGGKWRSRGLLCIKCNGDFGDGIDRVLDGQLGMFTVHLGIDRQREADNIAVPMKAPDGTIKMVGKQLKPLSRLTTKFPDKDDVVEYILDDQFEGRIAEKKVQLAKKYRTVSEAYYTELPVKEVHKIQNSLSGEEFDIGFGGDDFFRSVTKMAVNYYLKKGHDVQWVKQAISMIRGEIKNEITYYYHPNPIHYAVHDLGKSEVSHIIHIRGDSERKLLYAYVELFNMQNLLIRLNMNYEGPEINDTYAIDLLSGEEIEKKITIKLTKGHFEVLHLIALANVKEREAKYRRLERIIEKMQMNK